MGTNVPKAAQWTRGQSWAYNHSRMMAMVVIIVTVIVLPTLIYIYELFIIIHIESITIC